MPGIKLPEMNMVCITGRATRDAEVRGTGGKVMALSVSVNRRYLDKTSNEWKDDCTFVNCVGFGKSVEKADRISKGTPVMIEGRLATSDWETNTGEKRSQMQVVIERVQILESRDRAESQNSQTAQSEEAPPF